MSTAVGFDIDAIMDGIDRMAAHRPVAAQIVTTANDDNAGARELAAVLSADPTLSTVVLRFRPTGVDEDLADDLNPRIRAALWSDGRAVVAGTKVDGRSWLKLTLLNPAATLDDVRAVLERVRATGRHLLEHDLEGADR